MFGSLGMLPGKKGFSLSADKSKYFSTVAQGALIATLSKPFGTGTTYATIGSVPSQLALTGGQIVAGAGTSLTGTGYSITIRATAADGKREIAETLTFTAAAPPAVVPVPLSLNVLTYLENLAPGTVVAAISGGLAGSTVTLVNNAGNRIAKSGSNLVIGSVNTDFETDTTVTITLRQSRSGYADRDDVFAFTVGDVSEVSISVPAPELTRTSAAATNPPVFSAAFVAPSAPYTDFTRENDRLCVDWSTDPYFGSGVTTAKQTIDAAAIAAGTLGGFGWGVLSLATPWHFRFWVERAGIRVSPYSSRHRWNDSVGPAISSALATINNAERSKLAVTIAPADVSDPLASFRISGGADAAQFAADGLTLRWVGDGVQNFESAADAGANNVYDVLLRATDLAGNEGAEFAMAVTVTNIPDTMVPSPAITPIKNAVEGQTYTFPFSITNYSGVTAPGPLTWTGPMTVTKNGVVITSPNTFQDGDNFVVTGVGPAANVSTAQTLNFDGTIISCPIAGVLLMPQAANLGIALVASDPSKLFKVIAGGGANVVSADGDTVGLWQDTSPAARHMPALADNATRPTFRNSGGAGPFFVEFDGVDDVLQKTGTGTLAAFLQAAGTWTIVFATRGTGNATFKVPLSEGNSLDNDTRYVPISMSTNSAAGLGAFLRNDSAVQQVATSSQLRAGVWDGADTIIMETCDGTNITHYEDASAGSTFPFAQVAPMTTNRFALGALATNGAPAGFAPIRVYGLWIWPGVILSAGELAQARTTAAAEQGRVL